VQLRKNDNNTIEGSAIGVVSNILHSIFRSSSFHLNNILESQGDNNYNYKTHMQTILIYGRNASESHLSSQGYFPNFGRITAGKYVYPNMIETLTNMFQHSKKVKLYGKNHGDIFKPTSPSLRCKLLTKIIIPSARV